MKRVSEEADKLPVEVSATRLICASHGELMRPQWPKGFAVMSIALFSAAIGRDPATERGTLLKACGWSEGNEVPIGRINEITVMRPFCYFVTRDTLRQAYMDTEILSVGQCWACKRSGLGGEYQVSRPTGTETGWLCLECALDAGEREHRARPQGTRR